MSSPQITVEVVYAEANRQVSQQLTLARGTTMAQALCRVRELPAFAGVDCSRAGVFGELVDGGRVLQHGERLEIYRPLVADAKTARRVRAAEETNPAKKTGDGA